MCLNALLFRLQIFHEYSYILRALEDNAGPKSFRRIGNWAKIDYIHYKCAGRYVMKKIRSLWKDFSWNFDFGGLAKIWKENSSLSKVGQKEQALYIRT
jgi:hypothetical protein